MAEAKTKMVKVCAGAFSVFCAAAAKQKKNHIEAEGFKGFKNVSEGGFIYVQTEKSQEEADKLITEASQKGIALYIRA